MEKLVPISQEEGASNPLTALNNDQTIQIPYLPSKKIIIYRECLKNHAAAMGITARDGCGEFMPGEDEALICSACNCHRNFHKKIEFEANDHLYDHFDRTSLSPLLNNVVPFNSYMGGNLVISESDEMEEAVSKKRFRTKFSSEQKEKMLEFAESVGWKMQKRDEALVQKVCQEIGVKRRVLKVWMHNNKNNLGKKKSVVVDHADQQSESRIEDQS
ncbi:hypothetical protein CASFOL_004512 [Castilleja foliolosa]|uniref:ZF-HD dimerization-type domain-containing protein n=1 Tax=Castilleja foliolosa TaxID=1961234 RepID=A0ABD3EAN3_9LAMI